MGEGEGEGGQTFAGIVLDWDAADCDAGFLFGVGDVGEDYAFGEGISCFERHVGGMMGEWELVEGWMWWDWIGGGKKCWVD